MESNNTKDVDDKLGEIYDNEDKDQEMRNSIKKGKGFGMKMPSF